jgi:hypothetical protein
MLLSRHGVIPNEREARRWDETEPEKRDAMGSPSPRPLLHISAADLHDTPGLPCGQTPSAGGPGNRGGPGDLGKDEEPTAVRGVPHSRPWNPGLTRTTLPSRRSDALGLRDRARGLQREGLPLCDPGDQDPVGPGQGDLPDYEPAQGGPRCELGGQVLLRSVARRGAFLIAEKGP